MGVSNRNLISVIIPCYNSERYVGEALDSVLAQTYRPLEIIVVDDGSTDRTIEIVRARDASIVIVRHEKNRGPGCARNTGLQFARGAYIQFLDSDDLIAHEKLERQAAVLDADPACDLVFSQVHVFEDLLKNARPEAWREHKERQDYLGAFLVADSMAIHSPLVRRLCIERTGGFAADLSHGGEDWDLWIRMCLQRARFTFLPGVFAFYRTHTSSKCGLGYNFYTWECAVLPRAIEHLRAHGIKEPARWHALALGFCRLAIMAQRQGKQEDASRWSRQAAEIRPAIDTDWEQHSFSEYGVCMSTSYLGLSVAMRQAGYPKGAAEFRELAKAYLAVADAPVSSEERAIRRRILHAETQLCSQIAEKCLEDIADVCAVTGFGENENADETTLVFARVLDRLGRLESRPDILCGAARASEQAVIQALFHGERNRVSSGREWLLLRGRQALVRLGLRRLSHALALVRRSERTR